MRFRVIKKKNSIIRNKEKKKVKKKRERKEKLDMKLSTSGLTQLDHEGIYFILIYILFFILFNILIFMSFSCSVFSIIIIFLFLE